MKGFLIIIISLVLVCPSWGRRGRNTSSENKEWELEWEWEQTGYEDGNASSKVVYAGLGSGLLGCLGGVLLGPPTILTAGISGSVGCLGGVGLGSYTQPGPFPPTGKKSLYNAYLRGYDEGVSYSTLMSVLAGTGATILAILGSAYILSLIWSY